jgi:hypothetical protein
MDQALMQQLLPGTIRLETRVLNGAAHCRYLIPDQEGAEPASSEPDNNA